MKNLTLSPKTTLIFFLGFFAIAVLEGVWCFKSLQSINNIKNFTFTMSKLSEKSVLLVISHKDFNDEEYFIQKEKLEEVGLLVRTASDKASQAIGAEGGEAEVDFIVSQVDPENFDAVIFVGGEGALEYLDNEASYALARKAVEKDKILGAICIAPEILAKAGVLNGKKATVWSSAMDKGPIKVLKDKGAIYQNAAVVRDGKIITGNGPGAVVDFSISVIRALTQ